MFIVTQVRMLGVKSCGTVSCICSGTFLISHCSSVELVILHRVLFCMCLRIVRNLLSNRIIICDVTGEHEWNKSRKWCGLCEWEIFPSYENWTRGHATNIFWADSSVWGEFVYGWNCAWLCMCMCVFFSVDHVEYRCHFWQFTQLFYLKKQNIFTCGIYKVWQ